MHKKILIIKTGNSEVFTESTSSDVVSLGDVLRTTFILNFYDARSIDWLSSDLAKDLLSKKYINQVFYSVEDVVFKNYDLIINLEKDTALTSNLSTKNLIGFFYKKQKLMVKTIKGKEYSFHDFLIEVNHSATTFQQKLSYLLGRDWNGEKYMFDAPTNTPVKRVGLNWKAGNKWPEKQLEKEFWSSVYNDLAETKEVSWQKGFDSIVEYITWINSCETIITLDSLGLHLALAMNKKVIVLFGPTNPKHVELYDLGIKVYYNSDTKNDDLRQEIGKIILSLPEKKNYE